MPTAHLLIKRYWGVVALVLSVLTPTPVAAASYQSCIQGSPCVVGEFVYADDATPDAAATCQLTSFTQSGGSFLNAVPLTGTADAWYGYSFTPTEANPVGVYPSQICCTTTENNICIDKTFTLSAVVATPAPGLTTADVSNAVWDADSNTHTDSGSFGQQFNSLLGNIVSGVWNADTNDYTNTDSFGLQVGSLSTASNIVNEVWNYQDRSLNSYSDLIASVWSSSRATTSATTTSADLTEILKEIKAGRDLLEQLANAPTISTYLDADPSPKLESKLNSTQEFVAQIAANLELANTKVGLVTLKWDQLSDADRNQQIQQAVTLLGTDETQNPKTIIGQLNWLALAWDKPLTKNLYQDTVALRDNLSAFLTTLQASPPNPEQLAYLNQLYAQFTSIQVSIGDISQIDTDPTLFGLVKTLKNMVANLNSQEQALTAAVSDWDSTPTTVRPQIVSAIVSSLGKLNQLPALGTLLSPITPSKEFLSNLHSLINLNRTVMASSNGEAIAGTFISTDPIRFRTLVHNPSKRIAQIAKVSYLLPTELTQEQITNAAPEFTLTYDPSAKAIRVTGDIQLEPGESKIIDLTTNDIWQIRTEDIDSLRKQAAELIKPLENSSLYPQASTIKSNIDVALETVMALKDKATTPNGKIQAYHQAQVLIQQINHQLELLRDLVTSHQSNTSLMGFVGGAQAIAVWGIIIIFIAGFVFLTLYMRALYQNTLSQPASVDALTLPLTGPAQVFSPRIAPTFSLPFELPKFNFLTDRTFSISLTILSSLLLTLMLARHSPPSSTNRQAIPAVVTNPLPVSQLEIEATPSATPTATSAANLLITPSNAASTINVRRDPTTSSFKITQITTPEKAIQIEVSGDWYHVELIEHHPIVSGWVHRDYVSSL